MRLRFFRRPRFRFSLKVPRFLRTSFALSVALSLLMLFVATSFYFILQPVIPLFYSLAQPAQHLVAKEWLFLIPGLSFTITAVHLALVSFFHDYERLLLQLFMWTTILIQLLFFLALIRIVIIVT